MNLSSIFSTFPGSFKHTEVSAKIWNEDFLELIHRRFLQRIAERITLLYFQTLSGKGAYQMLSQLVLERRRDLSMGKRLLQVSAGPKGATKGR
jgi:hypothetical protein